MGLEEALRSAFGWADDAEAARGLSALFPSAATVDDAVGLQVLRSFSNGRMRSPFAAARSLPPVAPGAGMGLAGGALGVAGGGLGGAAWPAAGPATAAQAGEQPAPEGQRRRSRAPKEGDMQAPRPRGRPPMQNANYSKEYLAVKQYRERQKSMRSTLEAEVASKMAELQLLAAQNDALAARERVLHNVIAAGDSRVQQLQEAATARASRANSGSSATGGDDGDGGGGGGGRPEASGSSGAAAAAAAAGRAQADDDGGDSSGSDGGGSGDDADAASELIGFLSRYRTYVTAARAERLRPDGSVAPLPPGDPRAGELADLIHWSMTAPRDVGYRVLSSNAETGEGGMRMPPEVLSEGAQRLRLTPDQEARVLAAWLTFESALRALNEERAQLRAALAALQAHLEALPVDTPAFDEYELAHARDTGISSMLQSGDHEAIVKRLQDNMMREDQQWGILSWSLSLMVEEHQLTAMGIAVYPYIPSLGQVFAAYVTEVMRHRPGL
ncbi:hypothetical protein Rsub_08029 [Raphidocelis subcapitata]|uniref:Uncharacterized protein n=1 Tax=Raphidocelis subcapitata TaxID=307507 RepID=A0A2V0PCF7_9CHLO|nr:hypothetical protein Rsub_08029 [Raphidocelis subcapitata]|eukprot:GBF94857.1 hypothetical protein Rsub_08029 [Raphidocelis subcapitata]